MDIVIEQGTLQGLPNKTLLSDKPYISYLGIPYAKPPVDDLRFKDPVKHPGWTGVLKATTEGSSCTQSAIMTHEISGSEDCLYLNVLVPQNESNEKLAVMVFIHGGGFNCGSGSVNERSPDYLLDENVIVVTMNYRLNALGFLNLGIDDCPGNMGLKDQSLALKWVKANISAFGGDADNITIFGESAGSASVHYHILSPQSAGLFQKAIMQSGCAFNPWALNANHKELASKFANNLGCQSSDPEEILKYLKNASADDLAKKSKFKDDTDFLGYKFVPTLESEAISNPFLPSSPESLASSAPQIPIIIGHNDMEGILALRVQRIREFEDDHISGEIAQIFPSRHNPEIMKKIKEFYFNEQNVKSEITKLENICHLYSDVFFFKDYYHCLDHLLKFNTAPVYNYEFKFDGELNAEKNGVFITRPNLRNMIKGACHVDEVSYLFYGKNGGLAPKPNSPELEMCKMMSKLWTNFAKTSDPNSPDLSFKWINANPEEYNYLSIDGERTCMDKGMINGPRVRFWQSISGSLYGPE